MIAVTVAANKHTYTQTINEHNARCATRTLTDARQKATSNMLAVTIF